MRYLSLRGTALADLIPSILSPPDIPVDTSIKFTETLVLEGLVASIGTIGDAYDNAAAATVMGLCKNEADAKNSPSASFGPN